MQAELREACVVITDNAALIEEKERLIAIMTREKRELAQQNQVGSFHNVQVHFPEFGDWLDHRRVFFQDLIGDVEELHRICAELEMAPPAGTTEDLADQRHQETSELSEDLCKNMGHERNTWKCKIYYCECDKHVW